MQSKFEKMNTGVFVMEISVSFSWGENLFDLMAASNLPAKALVDEVYMTVSTVLNDIRRLFHPSFRF